MRVLVPVAVLALLALIGRAAPDGPKANDSPDDLFHPGEVAAGTFKKWQQEATKKYPKSINPYTRVEYDKRTFWVVQVHLGYGNPYKKVAVYAPAKDGSFQRCLLADSHRAVSLAVSVDEKTGVLEIRERADGSSKGELVLSCNLKTIGTPHSTGVSP
jgi:hypothetical protein